MRTSVERKRAALDGEGQGWLSRRTGATKKRRKAYDWHLYSFGGGFCLFVRSIFSGIATRRKEKYGGRLTGYGICTPSSSTRGA